MGRNVGRVCGALAATVALAVGILGLVPICPKWVWIGLGIAGLMFIVGQYVWERQSGDGSPTTHRVAQRQTSGRNSTNYQAGQDININPPSSKSPE